MTCLPAPTCRRALKEASERWPGRRTSSDGICASAQHSATNPTSDHELGNAFDLSHDPDSGVDTFLLAELMRSDPDPRVKYVISNGRIWNPSISPEWRTYTGSNPHTHHMHVSIRASARNDVTPWWDRYFPQPASQQEDDLLMAIAKDDDDARRLHIRQWCLEYWGREPTVDEQNILVYQWGLKGYADLALASVADHPNAKAFRQKRGW